jgi:hypothetical protein
MSHTQDIIIMNVLLFGVIFSLIYLIEFGCFVELSIMNHDVLNRASTNSQKNPRYLNLFNLKFGAIDIFRRNFYS